MAAPTFEELVALLSPDLQGLLDARKVPKAVQAELAKQGIDNIAMLSAVAVDRAGLQQVAKDALGVDVTAGGDEAIKFAQIYLAWQAVRGSKFRMRWTPSLRCIRSRR